MKKRVGLLILIMLCVISICITVLAVGCQPKDSGESGSGENNSGDIGSGEQESIKEEMALYEVRAYGSEYSVMSLTPNILSVNNNIVMAENEGQGKLIVVEIESGEQSKIDVSVNTEYPYGMKIKNYNQKIIDNFVDNKYAFTVSADNDVSVTDNGEQLQVGQGVYSYGNHVIKLSKGSESRFFSVNILPPTENGATYDIIATYATLPTLYAGLDMATSQNEKFIWFGRSGTLSTDILESDSKVVLSKYMADTTKLAVEVVDEIKTYCYNVLEKDKDAKFRLFVDDFRHWIEITTFAEMGLQDDRYEVFYCTDGTYTYTKQFSYRNGPIEKFNECVASREEMVENARSNKYAEDEKDSYMNGGSYTKIDFNDDFIIAGALRDNIHYWAQYPEYCNSTDAIIQDIFYKAIEKKLPENMYKSMSDEQKQNFLSLINFDKKAFDEQYFSDDNGKSYLIVTGTNPYTEKSFNYIKIIKERYGDEYNIVFKPHPSAIPAGEDADKLAELQVKVLPGRLPMEAILWVYPEYKIGGYNSSLYMSAPKGNTLFFMDVKDKNSLVSPINSLYDVLFSNAEFIVIE